jgi:hypothetical protein
MKICLIVIFIADVTSFPALFQGLNFSRTRIFIVKPPRLYSRFSTSRVEKLINLVLQLFIGCFNLASLQLIIYLISRNFRLVDFLFMLHPVSLADFAELGEGILNKLVGPLAIGTGQ